jgi:hypothetical protein
LDWRLQPLPQQARIDARHIESKNDGDGEHLTEIKPSAGIVDRPGCAENDCAHEAKPDDRLDKKIEYEAHLSPSRIEAYLSGMRRLRFRASSLSTAALQRPSASCITSRLTTWNSAIS